MRSVTFYFYPGDLFLFSFFASLKNVLQISVSFFAIWDLPVNRVENILWAKQAFS
jgi:hypothetical protein